MYQQVHVHVKKTDQKEKEANDDSRYFLKFLTRKGASESEHDLRSKMNNLSVKKNTEKIQP